MPVVWGGWHTTLLPEQVCKDPSIDYAVVGEGEVSFIELLKRLKAGKPADDIPGVLTKKNVDSRPNIYARKFVDIEKQPLFDYSLIDIEKHIQSKDFFGKKVRTIYYESSRGCPHRCAFCINVVAGNQMYRKKSTKKVLDELETLYKKYKFTNLNFIDDNFCIDMKRFKEICQGLIDRKIRVKWFCECRVDYFKDGRMDDSALKLARKSGLSQMTLGLESGSQKTLKMIKKDITLAESMTAAKQCAKFKIVPAMSFIIGFPGESKKEVKKTIRFVNAVRRACPISRIGIGVFRPYPRCDLTQQIIKQGYFKEPKTLRDWTKNNFDSVYSESTNNLPWQNDPKFLDRVSFYFSLALRISSKKQYQAYLKSWFGIPYLMFVSLAKLRLKFMIFGFPLDKVLYNWLAKRFMKLQYLRRG